MLAAFLTTIFFSLSAIFANRSIRAVGPTQANLGRLTSRRPRFACIRAVGPTQANLGRLLVALVCLGAYAHLAGGALGGAGRNWFFLSGLVGMGLGDLASFAALPLLGARLTLLMTQCLAVPIAMLAEWIWLGTTLRATQLSWSFVILAGVIIALMPSRLNPPRVQVKPIGFIFGFLAACGQGIGAVISRKANGLVSLSGEPIDGITAAYHRIIGGLVITVAYFGLRSLFGKTRAEESPSARRRWRDYGWVPANALCGAVIGVSCYQWSLATTPSGIVLPIVATTPLIVIPLSYWLEGERPTRRSLFGGLIAVTGVIALTIAR